MFLFRFLTGHALLLAVLGKAEKLITHLDRAVSHLREDFDNNEVEIDRLMQKNAQITVHAERAVRVSKKFRDLLA